MSRTCSWMNTAHDVWYKVREKSGVWSNWSPVGIGVGAASISATTIANKPYVSMQNAAGNIYINTQTRNRRLAGLVAGGNRIRRHSGCRHIGGRFQL